ncbi:MAG: molecular chaperone DnaJ [Alphaproteobacteria bacterium]|nr:molecular chaperone DnaJ [Alphaproteobacteria bacterium]
MTYLLLGLGVLVLAVAVATQFQKANPRALAKWLRRAGAAAALALAVYLIVSGRFAHALPALIGGALLLGRLRGLGHRLGGASSSGRGGRTSEVVTSHLRAWLDHDSGEVTGTVLRGAFASRTLVELREDDLVALHAECLREDEEAARLVEAYLDRGPYGATWRARRGAQDTGGGPMTAEEARRILGVAPEASPEAIRDAHRKLMMANHPDRGGSVYLAAKINQARDVLLGS